MYLEYNLLIISISIGRHMKPVKTSRWLKLGKFYPIYYTLSSTILSGWRAATVQGVSTGHQLGYVASLPRVWIVNKESLEFLEHIF